jgi:hypothetical protein
MVVDGDGERLLGVLLADDVVLEMRDDLSWRRNIGEELFGVSATSMFLVED